MNSIPSMDRHIQQTNDRLQCIKQVRRSVGRPPAPRSWSPRVDCLRKRGRVDLGAVLMSPQSPQHSRG